MQPSEEFEQNNFDRIQCALDIVHTIDELEYPLQSRSSTPKDTALLILEVACKFYDADWCGLIQVDLDLRLWTPFWWHNTGVEDKTTILTEEFESADFLDRWVLAIRKNLPMVVPDTTVVKDSHPTEYNLYQRLSIKSVMAVSLEPRPIALFAVRNPKRYLHQTSMLRVLAYVLLASYNEQKMLNRLQMVCIPTTIKNNTDIYISLFGQLQISTSNGTLKESDYNSPRISQLLTYLLISNEKAHSSLEIAQALWPDDSTNPAKNMRNLIYRLRQTFGLISDAELIVSTASGYQFNPKIHIIADYQQFDEFIRLASAASSIINRVELLKSAIDLYNGKILSSAEGEHWLIQFATKYHIAYIGAVNELLKQLASLHSYDLLNQYAMRSLTIAPENTKGYYWLIRSLKAQGMDELASNEYRLAKQKLTDNEYLDLLDLLANSQE
jgi:DNA-binding SARP family transcriptional activator